MEGFLHHILQFRTDSWNKNIMVFTEIYYELSTLFFLTCVSWNPRHAGLDNIGNITKSLWTKGGKWRSKIISSQRNDRPINSCHSPRTASIFYSRKLSSLCNCLSNRWNLQLRWLASMHLCTISII